VYQNFAFIFPDDFDAARAAELQVCNAFILTLPFRLRTGPFFAVPIGDTFTVVFRNVLDIPQGTSQDEIHDLLWEDKAFRPREQFFTEAMVLDKHPRVSPQFRQKFIAFLQDSDNNNLPRTKERYFEAMARLNDAIVGYHHATNSLFGGAVLERLTAPVFFLRLRYLHTIVCPPGYELTESQQIEVLEARGDRTFTRVEGEFTTGQLDDVPKDQLTLVQRYTQLHQRFLFYQFALDAKSKMVEQDFVSAILFAVVALEGVHSALLQIRLAQRMAQSIRDPDIRAKKAEAVANRLLKEVGISESLEMTSLLFLDPQERPPDDELLQCKLGITIRNEIMHALAKKGQYRLRNRTNKQISDAYSNVLKVFSHFASIVERDTEMA
jgi:hypothetical protein